MIDLNTRTTWHVGLTTRKGVVLSAAAVIPSTIVPIMAAAGHDGFSVVEQIGYWKGVQEASLTITVFTYQSLPHMAVIDAETVALTLAAALDQEVVLWDLAPVTAGLTYNPDAE